MKYIFLATFLVNALTVAAQIKGDNTIIVNRPVQFSSLKMILFNNGYNIDNADSTFITTTEKSMKTNTVCRLMIARTDTSTIIKGQGKLAFKMKIFGSEMENTFDQVEYAKAKSSIAYEWFSEMNKIADGIGGNKTFLKQ